MRPALEALGFTCRVLRHEKARGPLLYAERLEGKGLPTVLGYGHGDVIRGLEACWREGLAPWTLSELDGRYYGRGVVDNKGQHTINFGGLEAVLKTRGKLGFQRQWLIEMGEEIGSPGLREVCSGAQCSCFRGRRADRFGRAAAFDRPPHRLPGLRGSLTRRLWIDAREGGHHSGNWGGLLSNPASSSPTRMPAWPGRQDRSGSRLVPVEVSRACGVRLTTARSTGGPDGRRRSRLG